MGSLNLCLKKLDSMQKESAQSDHPSRRKCPKCGPIAVLGERHNIQIFVHVLDIFSKKVIGFSCLLLHWVRLLETPVYTTTYSSENFKILPMGGSPPLEGPWKYFLLKTNFTWCSFIYCSPYKIHANIKLSPKGVAHPDGIGLAGDVGEAGMYFAYFLRIWCYNLMDPLRLHKICTFLI